MSKKIDEILIEVRKRNLDPCGHYMSIAEELEKYAKSLEQQLKEAETDYECLKKALNVAEKRVKKVMKELDKHQEARRRLEKIDEAECSISVWDAVCCAIQIITRPENK